MNKTGLRKLNKVSEKYKNLLLDDIENKTIKTEEVTSCECCNSDNLEQLLEVDRFDLPFGSYMCKECGLVITSPRIKQESLPYYYEKYYHPLNYGKEDLGNQVALFAEGQGKKIYNKLHKYFLDKVDLNVLEIGAGVGNVLDEFRAEALDSGIKVNLLGTEYSAECIVQCNTRNVETIAGNAKAVLKYNKKFDVIILSHVFEHFIDLENELNILKQLLNDDGLLYIEVPGILKNHNKAYYDFSFLGYSVHAHMYNFSLVTLKNTVEKHGFYLKDGNEEVEAIFQTKEEIKFEIVNDNIRIKHYLDFLEDNQFFAMMQKEKFLKAKERIETRDMEILKFKDIRLKQNVKIKAIEKLNSLEQEEDKKIIKAKNKVLNIKVLLHPIKKYKACQNLIKVIYEIKG